MPAGTAPPAFSGRVRPGGSDQRVAVVEGAVTPAPTTPPATAPADGASAGGAGTAGDGRGPLAFTGSEALPALLLALMLAGAGTALVLRRRHRATSAQDGVQL